MGTNTFEALVKRSGSIPWRGVLVIADAKSLLWFVFGIAFFFSAFRIFQQRKYGSRNLAFSFVFGFLELRLRVLDADHPPHPLLQLRSRPFAVEHGMILADEVVQETYQDVRSHRHLLQMLLHVNPCHLQVHS